MWNSHTGRLHIYMARKNPEREALLAEVMKRQRAAGKKVSRLKANGVKVSKVDPRKPAAHVRKLNTRQLRAHLGRLNTFTSRNTQFTAKGERLSPTALARYRSAETRINNAKKAILDKIGHIKAPGAGGLTIKERLAVVTPDRPRAGNPAANPFTFVKRKGTSFTSPEAMAKLTKDLEGKLKSDFLAKDLLADRGSAKDMLATLREPKMQEKLDKLSDFHFNILWNFTSFATDISYPYELAKRILEGKGDAWHHEKLAENVKNADSLIDQVKKIRKPKGM